MVKRSKMLKPSFIILDSGFTRIQKSHQLDKTSNSYELNCVGLILGLLLNFSTSRCHHDIAYFDINEPLSKINLVPCSLLFIILQEPPQKTQNACHCLFGFCIFPCLTFLQPTSQHTNEDVFILFWNNTHSYLIMSREWNESILGAVWLVAP